MIVSRAPVRFSLGGGGTDLPAYAEVHGGYVISAAIDKYVYVCANSRFYRDIRLSYAKTEIAPTVAQIEHPIFREALRLSRIEHGIELVSVADLPANTGLGSSGAFTVALLNALHAYKREFVSSRELAEEACHVEIDRLREPVGRQDQYIAAFGGICAFTFEAGGKVSVERLPVDPEVALALEHNLVVVYSGVERPARVVLAEQGQRLSAPASAAVDGMHRIKAMGHEVRDILLSGELDRYGALLHAHWEAKRGQAGAMTDPELDAIYALGRDAGALGGKLMGAGGGGFFMFYVRAEDRRRFTAAIAARGLVTLPFRFDGDGARILANMGKS